jgi:hypothetical protein
MGEKIIELIRYYKLRKADLEGDRYFNYEYCCGRIYELESVIEDLENILKDFKN